MVSRWEGSRHRFFRILFKVSLCAMLLATAFVGGYYGQSHPRACPACPTCPPPPTPGYADRYVLVNKGLGSNSAYANVKCEPGQTSETIQGEKDWLIACRCPKEQ